MSIQFSLRRLQRWTFALALFFAAGGLSAADLNKVLHVAFVAPENGFDPQASNDLYSNYVNREIFDSLYRYDFLARPYKVVPNTAAALPQISADGLTWTIKIKPSIYFSDDPAFKGKKRELIAADYVYSFKRLLDPALRSNNVQILDDRLVGAKEAIEAAKKIGKFNYDAPLEGAQAIDRYTLRLKLNYPAYDLLPDLTSSATGAVASEVVAAYKDPSGWVMEHPVGTGPYYLKSWRRGQQIVLEANPNFRDMRFPESVQPDDQPLLAKMKGKKLPICGRVEISIIEESNPRLLAFNSGALDYANVPSDLSDTVLDANSKLRPDYAQRGVVLARVTQPALQYAYFNMEDPVVGGYGKEKIALRRAIALGFDRQQMIRVVYQGQAIPASQPIPPNLPGHDDSWSVDVKYDPAAANALLERFGYRDRDGDGSRELPDGKPFTIVMASATSARDREFDELWQKSMKGIGIRLEFLKSKFPDLLKMGKAGQLQMWRVGWINLYGEGDAFMQLLYGPNIGQTNYARFSLPEYDELYRASRRLPDGPERNKIYRRMSEIVAAYNPWWLGFYTIENTLVQPWMRGYKKHVYWEHPWKYLDVDERRQAAR